MGGAWRSPPQHQQCQQQQQLQLPLVAELTAPMHAPVNVLAQPDAPLPPPVTPPSPSSSQQQHTPDQPFTLPLPHLHQQLHPAPTASPSRAHHTHPRPTTAPPPPPWPAGVPQGTQPQQFIQGGAQGSPCASHTSRTSSHTSTGDTGSCPASPQPTAPPQPTTVVQPSVSAQPTMPPQPAATPQTTASPQPTSSDPHHHPLASPVPQPPAHPVPAASSPWGGCHAREGHQATYTSSSSSMPTPALLAADLPSSTNCGVAARAGASMPAASGNLAATVSGSCSSSSSVGMMAGQAPAGTAFPPRILIAEDNKVNQKVVLKVLQQVAGSCKPDVVENGLQVLRALEEKVYDLILMDIHMPEMDGLEATRCIMQRFPQGMRPRIIALSADTLKALHDRCKEAGIEEFLEKPFRVEDLKRVMQSCSLQNIHKGGGSGSGFKQRSLGQHAMPTPGSPAAHQQAAQQQQQQQQAEHTSSKGGGVCGAA
mmetsp:Transcript_21719/g.60233  ORF Transcript_21719/g.60233 Transcript_21719/m.60233 type:complete len:482 (+) Transcript_21719:275-1720(+)